LEGGIAAPIVLSAHMKHHGWARLFLGVPLQASSQLGLGGVLGIAPTHCILPTPTPTPTLTPFWLCFLIIFVLPFFCVVFFLLVVVFGSMPKALCKGYLRWCHHHSISTLERASMRCFSSTSQRGISFCF
jgi:hypothetical protein